MGAEEEGLSGPVAAAADELARRRARDRTAGPLAELFGEPAWDLLLDLYVRRGRGARVSAACACATAGVGTAAALRWLAVLGRRGLVRRFGEPGQRSYGFVELTDEGARLVERLLPHRV